jgi:hypothetical protein
VKLTVFQSANGDCLLVESRDGKRMLVDGGLASSFEAHVAPALGKLRDAGHALDLVCVSHVDGDHIGGILTLLDTEVEWRVHAFQSADAESRHRPPRVPRPPDIVDLWHNGFSEQLDADVRPVGELLSQSAGTLELSEDDDLLDVAERHRELGNSAGDGIRLSHRIDERQLGIPLNRHFGEKLALVRKGRRPVKLGTLRLTLIGPFEEDVEKFREEWRQWIRANEKELTRIRERTRRDLERLDLGEVGGLRDALTLSAGRFGDRDQVTAPNLASIMLLVREQGKTLLLTGDGHGDDVLKGLERTRAVPKGGGLHVDVLKLQHHGSEFNVPVEFCRRVTADHYVICANGGHHNPDREVLEVLLASRLGSPEERSPNAEAGRPFTLWFNSSPKVAGSASRRAHMKMVQTLVTTAAAAHPGRLETKFLEASSFELDV